MPISLGMIETKLKNHEFSTLSELESYCKRMVSNAKEFYARGSTNFEDAERVRKNLSNFMTKNNPAYASGNYTAVPTPLPADAGSSEASPAPAATPTVSTRVRLSTSRSRAAKKAEEEEDEEEEEEDEEEEDGDEEEEEEPVSKRASIILRKGSGRRSTPRGSETPASRGAARPKALDVYQNVPYKGLSFQEAQEKIAEEIMRKRDE